jgi:2-dehydro-3-deoxy-D-pentonate aldolase
MNFNATKIRGTIVPMISPFTADRQLDEEATTRLVDRLASHRLGVFVLGTTGEAASIPPELRRRLVELAVAAADRRVPVFAGIGDNCVVASVEAARSYLALGVDGVVAHLPSYYVLKAGEMEDYFRLLSAETGGPLIVYNIPQATRMSLPVEIVERLADDPNIVGFKDSEAAPGRLERVAELARRPDFSVFMGVARLSVAAMQAGYDGLVPSSGNLDPAAWHELYLLTTNGEWAGANELQERLDALGMVYQEDHTLGQSLAALKAAMAIEGLCQPYVLPPLHTFDAARSEAIRHRLASCRVRPSVA